MAGRKRWLRPSRGSAADGDVIRQRGPRDDRATAPETVPGTAPAAVTRRHDQAASASYPPRVSPARRREGGGRREGGEREAVGGRWAVEDGRW